MPQGLSKVAADSDTTDANSAARMARAAAVATETAPLRSRLCSTRVDSRPLGLCIVTLCVLVEFVQPVWADSPKSAENGKHSGGEHVWLRHIRQLTTPDMGFTRAGEGYFDQDGTRIVFQAVPKGKTDYQIYVANLRHAASGLKLDDVRMVSTGEGATTCAWFHPSGETLLFASNHLDQRPAEPPKEVKEALGRAAQSRYTWPFQPGMDIFEYRFASKELRQITRAEGYDAEGSLSPDGKKLVFTSFRDGDAEIYVSDADGSNAVRITRTKGYDGGAFFSPDGKRIVYRSDRKNENDGTMQIFVNDLTGNAEKALTDHSTLHWCPYWHPSGKWLIYTRGDHPKDGPPRYDLHLLRDDGSQDFRVTFDPSFDGLPAFSADGRYLMWSSRRGGNDSPHQFIAEFIGLNAAGEFERGE